MSTGRSGPPRGSRARPDRTARSARRCRRSRRPRGRRARRDRTRRVIDEPEPVAIRRRRRRFGHVRPPSGASGSGTADRPTSPDRRHRHAAVPWQEDVDRCRRSRPAADRGPSERVDHVAETAGLGKRLALGSDHRDAQRHRAIVVAADGSGPWPCSAEALGRTCLTRRAVRVNRFSRVNHPI